MFARRFIPVDVYFISSFPLLTFINTKGNICSEEFLVLLMKALILSLSRINKHTSSMEIYQLRYVALRCVTFFFHTSEPLRIISTSVNVLQFFFHTKELLII